MADVVSLIEQLENVGLPAGSYDIIPIDRLRRIIATRTAQTIRDVPHFPLNIEVALNALLAQRADYNQANRVTKISINDMIVKAAGLALTAVPGVNVSYTPDAIIQHKSADIAVVVAIKNGLVTPIVRGVERKPLSEIAAELRDLSARAQTMRLKPVEYAGGTFSISNLGMFGISSFGSIINPPHGAILSVGTSRQVPMLTDGELRNQTMMTITLTCDHRVIDGVTGARWLQSFRSLIESPDTLLG